MSLSKNPSQYEVLQEIDNKVDKVVENGDYEFLINPYTSYNELSTILNKLSKFIGALTIKEDFTRLSHVNQINLDIVEIVDSTSGSIAFTTRSLKFNKDGLFLDNINLSMTPSDITIQDFDARPIPNEVLFTAPTNGVFYARYTTNAGGTLGLHLRTSNDINLSYNTQILTGTAIYNAVFVMKQGQKIYCYENTLNIIWGDYSFVKSERG